jgi:hypothetical protein
MNTTRSVRFDAPHVHSALAALDDGRLPDESTTRGALRQLRRARQYIARRGKPGANADALRQLDDWLDVLRWSLSQPRGLNVRKCDSCGRHPARFGGLCGRCAEARGVRPHGRIGTTGIEAGRAK